MLKKACTIIPICMFLSACGNQPKNYRTFSSESDMLNYLTSCNWKSKGSDSAYFVFSDYGFCEFSNGDTGAGRMVTLHPENGTFDFNGVVWGIDSDTGNILNTKNSNDCFSMNLFSPDVEIGKNALKNYIYSSIAPNSGTTVSVQVTNNGILNYSDIAYSITLSDNNGNSMELETDKTNLSFGQNGSCSVYSHDAPYSYTNIDAKLCNYDAKNISNKGNK